LDHAAELVLTDRAYRDIVDTEHSTGDLNKMLLGSFVEEYDKKDEMISSPPLTPSRGSSYGRTKSPPLPPAPIFPDLIQKTSPPPMPPRSDTLHPSVRMSQVAHGGDPNSRRPEKEHKIPSIHYSGH
jgi:hypothetical protein